MIELECRLCGKVFRDEDYEEVHHKLFGHYLEKHKECCEWLKYVEKYTVFEEK